MVSELFRDMIERADKLDREATAATLDSTSRHVAIAESQQLVERASRKREHAADLRRFARRLPR